MYTRLPMLRAERQMSRKDLAAAVDVHYQTIGYIERGEYSPSLVLAMTISQHFDLPVDAVFSLTPFAPLSAQDLPYPSSRHPERTSP